MSFESLSWEALKTGHRGETERQRNIAIANAVKLSDAKVAKLEPIERDEVELRKQQNQLDQVKERTAHLEKKVKTMNKTGVDDRMKLGKDLDANVKTVQNLEASVEARAWTDHKLKALLVHELQETKHHAQKIFNLAQKDVYARSPSASPGFEGGYR